MLNPTLKSIIGLPAVCFLAFLFAACAPTERQEAERQERQQIAEAYDRHTTGSRDATVYPAPRQWYYLGNDKLVVQTRRYTYFVVEVNPGCGMDLSRGSTARLSTEQQSRNQFTRRDKILFADQECQVTGIWEVDHKAAREELDEKGIRHTFLRVRED